MTNCTRRPFRRPARPRPCRPPISQAPAGRRHADESAAVPTARPPAVSVQPVDRVGAMTARWSARRTAARAAADRGGCSYLRWPWSPCRPAPGCPGRAPRSTSPRSPIRSHRSRRTRRRRASNPTRSSAASSRPARGRTWTRHPGRASPPPGSTSPRMRRPPGSPAPCRWWCWVTATAPSVDPAAPGTVTVTGFRPGTLDADRSFHTDAAAVLRQAMHLVQVDGEWRISDPPPELLLTSSEFSDGVPAAGAVLPGPIGDGRGAGRPARGDRPDPGQPGQPADVAADPRAERGADAAPSTRSSPRSRRCGRTPPSTRGRPAGRPHRRRRVDRRRPAGRWPRRSSGRCRRPRRGSAITVDGEPLDPAQPVYTINSVSSFDPDRVAGTGQVASDPFYVNPARRDRRAAGRAADARAAGHGATPGRSAPRSRRATGTIAAVAADPGRRPGSC